MRHQAAAIDLSGRGFTEKRFREYLKKSGVHYVEIGGGILVVSNTFYFKDGEFHSVNPPPKSGE